MAQLDLLEETLLSSQGEGPNGEGWKSPALQALTLVVSAKLKEISK